MLFPCIFQKRSALEESNQLELRVSALDEDLEDMETSDEEEVVVRWFTVMISNNATSDLDLHMFLGRNKWR